MAENTTIPPAGAEWNGGFVRDETTGLLWIQIAGGAVVLEVSDLEIGAVEIKDGATDQRATVNGSGELLVRPPAGAAGLTDAELRATPVPVEQATSVDVADGGGSLTVDSPQLPAALDSDRLKVVLPAGGGGLTDAELRATPVSVEQATSVDVGNFPATQPVSIAGTVAVEQQTSVDVADGGGSLTVDGPVTDGQLRATPVPVEQATAVDIGNFPGTQPVSIAGTVAVEQATSVDVADGGGSLTVDGPVTDAQLRATPVPVEQATSVDVLGPVTDAQLRATPVPVEQATSVDAVLLAGTAAIGQVGLEPRVSGGLSTFHLVSAATTNATSVKGSAGQLYGYYIYNSNAAARKVAFHNTAGVPTAGAAVFFSVVIPPGSAANVEFTNGVVFGTGIGITTVTEIADAGTTGVGADDLLINLFYK